MIQLANDPNASRQAWRPAAPAAPVAAGQDAARRRNGHAWPFLSPHARQAERARDDRPAARDSGS